MSEDTPYEDRADGNAETLISEINDFTEWIPEKLSEINIRTISDLEVCSESDLQARLSPAEIANVKYCLHKRGKKLSPTSRGPLLIDAREVEKQLAVTFAAMFTTSLIKRDITNFQVAADFKGGEAITVTITGGEDKEKKELLGRDKYKASIYRRLIQRELRREYKGRAFSVTLDINGTLIKPRREEELDPRQRFIRAATAFRKSRENPGYNKQDDQYVIKFLKRLLDELDADSEQEEH